MIFRIRCKGFVLEYQQREGGSFLPIVEDDDLEKLKKILQELLLNAEAETEDIPKKGENDR